MARVDALRTAARSLRRDLRDIGFALRHCRRPLRLVAAIVRRVREPAATLHDGTTIVAPEMRALLWLLDEIFIERAYERGVVRVRPGDVVVDVGAHVGMFTVHAMQSGAAHVIAYEPLPDNVRLLERNIERNASGARVTVVAKAVSDREGTATLGVGRVSVGNVLADAVPREAMATQIAVPTTTLAQIFHVHGLDRIDYLKIDCEGSEGAVLSDASDSLLQRIDRIALEYHDDWSSLDHDAIVALLRRAGFATEMEPERGTNYGMIYAWREHSPSSTSPS